MKIAPSLALDMAQWCLMGMNGGWFIMPGYMERWTRSLGGHFIIFEEIFLIFYYSSLRQLMLDKIVWQAGWPTVGTPSVGKQQAPVDINKTYEN